MNETDAAWDLVAEVIEPFLTDGIALNTVEADQFHRQHAVVELAIRELKDGGAEHIPSGH